MSHDGTRMASEILRALEDMKHLEDISDDSKRDMGRKLAKLRKSAGMRQQDLADQLGISRSLVASWEQGRNAISMPQAIELARVLGVDVPDFVPHDVYFSSREKRLWEMWRTIPEDRKEAVLQAIEQIVRVAK